MDSVFCELYEKYHRDLFQFLFYMVRSKEEAEDLVQEVYIRVLHSYGRFEGKSSEKTWLFSIAKNVAIDHFRKHKNWKERLYQTFDWNEQQVKDTSPLPEELTLKNENIQFLYKSLELCRKNHQLVLVMRFINELSIAETAEALNWSESKVKTTQHRAIKSLRAIMADKMGKEGRHDA